MTRHAPDPMTESECQACHHAFTSPRRGPGRSPVKFCSILCREYVRHDGEWMCELPAKHPARARPAPPASPSSTSRARWIVGRCHECDEHFVVDNHFVSRIDYCSKQCARRVARRARKAREHNAPGTFRYSEVMRVYMKQGRVCAYCQQPAQGLPDPEHVTPISRGGRNDMTNIVAACRSCNADKCDLTLDEWAASRSRRGLPTVRTQLDPHSVAFAHLVRTEPVGLAYQLSGETVDYRRAA